MAEEVNEENEKMMREYQMLQEQLRSGAMQIEQLQIQKNDLTMAKTEVEKSSGKVYFTKGGIIVETNKDQALKDITEKLELAEVRMQAINKQYTELRNKDKELREKITKAAKG